MESNTKTPSSGANYPESRKRVPMYLVFLVVTLSVVAILLGIKLYVDSRAHKENMDFVEGEKQKLETELNELIVEYDSLKSNNDTLAIQLTAEQERIRDLLKRQASSATKIKMYEKELETLRKVMRSYIVQIDSLNTRNQMLTAENISVRQELSKVTTDFEEVTKQKDELSSTVKIAQQLRVGNISAVGLKGNKETAKAKKVEKIRVCFTLRENAVAEAGTKTVYVRITRPDNFVLSSPEAGMFMLNGEQTVYSAKRDIDYENVDLEACIYWNATEELIPGTYLIGLYAEGYEITGSEPLELK